MAPDRRDGELLPFYIKSFSNKLDNMKESLNVLTQSSFTLNFFIQFTFQYPDHTSTILSLLQLFNYQYNLHNEQKGYIGSALCSRY